MVSQIDAAAVQQRHWYALLYPNKYDGKKEKNSDCVS